MRKQIVLKFQLLLCNYGLVKQKAGKTVQTQQSVQEQNAVWFVGLICVNTMSCIFNK